MFTGDEGRIPDQVEIPAVEAEELGGCGRWSPGEEGASQVAQA